MAENLNNKKKRGDSISKQEYINCYFSAAPKEKKKEKLIEQAFNIALETRRFEIELYWKRTAYFILFIGAVFIGYYQIIREFGLRKSL